MSDLTVNDLRVWHVEHGVVDQGTGEYFGSVISPRTPTLPEVIQAVLNTEGGREAMIEALGGKQWWLHGSWCHRREEQLSFTRDCPVPSMCEGGDWITVIPANREDAACINSLLGEIERLKAQLARE